MRRARMGGVMHPQFTALHRHRAQDGPQQRGLAGAAGSQQADEIAGHYAEVHVAENRHSVVTGRYVSEFNDRPGVGIRSVQVIQLGRGAAWRVRVELIGITALIVDW